MRLTQREIDVLSTLIQDYILTGQPVGSRTVAKKSQLNLSPATIRNIMADLSERGLLSQPHTSAGRVPTTKAFRYYLDSILTISPLPLEEQQRISKTLEEVGPDLPQTLSQASKILSSLSNQISMVLTPRKSLVRWQQIDFILLRPGLVMSVLVLDGGLIQNKVIQVDKDITADELIKYSNFLNDSFQGRTLYQVREEILEQMKKAHLEFEHLYKKALKLAQDTFEANNRQVFVEGTINLLEGEELSDINAMRDLFKILEEKSKLLQLLDKTIESRGLNIILGEEQNLEELQEYSVISSPYSIKDDTLGVVSVIGPMRMDYSKVIPTVDLMAKILSQIFRKHF
ncbi:heat-inducible transcription repressor HrcA [Desulfohalobiaceae bacterium Ax17]|uniref:heat-inducible transcriptional repressor HrcA n=1 Tax=Desulfovulcanus ferrireducens TaxID=2831190 RepID=UPI00207BC30E|nr:heat-inducible transcriptional repressor HrcA [Desulfovulcanus ferrireducens]MBT8763586.1 heat-inducible transcription repressor HrcA [Desulfovulcanus ferrireducens]